MSTWLETVTSQRAETPRRDKRRTLPFSRKTIFGPKLSEEWRRQVDFTAGVLHPSDEQFPWSSVRSHTDAYIKKKGKLPQSDIDARLAVLINTHDAKDIAIAACAHAMSSASVRALLDVQLNVAPATLYGVEMYLRSIIAANYSNPKSISDIEAQWAKIILPYVSAHGADVAGRFLEGGCQALWSTDTPSMDALPDFKILLYRELETFECHLDGFRLKSQWDKAWKAVAWMSRITSISPVVTQPGKLLPEHLLDSHFSTWRIWSTWRPNLTRIKLLGEIDSTKRGVLPDLLALEGPDFVTGQCHNLRDGLIMQYGSERPLLRFKSLLVAVPSCDRKELGHLLNKVATLMDIAVTKGSKSFELFVQFTVARPIARENLDILEAVLKFPATLGVDLENAVLEVLSARPNIGGKHIMDLSYIILALDHPNGGGLRDALLHPWFIAGIEKCLLECQRAVRTYIEGDLKWEHLLRELHSLSSTLKESETIRLLLAASIRQQLDVTPTAYSRDLLLEIYNTDRAEESVAAKHRASALKKAIEEFFIDRFIEKGTVTVASCKIIQAVLDVWTQTSTPSYRRLAILLTRLSDKDLEAQYARLSQVKALSADFVESVLLILKNAESHGPESCVQLTELLATRFDTDLGKSYAAILYSLLEQHGESVIDYAIDNMNVLQWAQFLRKLHSIFKDVINDPWASPPRTLQLDFHTWNQNLSCTPGLMFLQRLAGPLSKSAMKCILRGGRSTRTKMLLQLLVALNETEEGSRSQFSTEIVCELAANGRNLERVCECVTALLDTSQSGYDVCKEIRDSSFCDTLPAEVREVVVAGWLEDEDTGLNASDKVAIKALAGIYGIRTYNTPVPKGTIMVAMKYYEEQEARILAEADRLETIKNALKEKDPNDTAVLLRQMGYPDASMLDEELAALPPGIVDYVEKYSKNELEFSFPLGTFTELQRAATGIGAAKVLLVRLFMSFEGKMPPAFCMHLDNGAEVSEAWKNPRGEHSPWICFESSSEPVVNTCHGKQTLLTFHLSRILHRHMKKPLEIGISGLYYLLKRCIGEYAQSCLVCGVPHRDSNGVTLKAGSTAFRKPLPCTGVQCTKLWNSMSIDLRIPEIRSDPFVVDVLLTGAYAAACSGRPELLPRNPLSNWNNVRTILNKLPSIPHLSTQLEICEVLKGCHKDAEKLLIWACTHFGGLLSSASGMCRIANLPTGTHQFVLASARPEMESAFHKKLPRLRPQTRVLFHGTSLDRLPAILAQGLKIQSGTALQRTGAAHGKGIYMAEDPATAFTYSPAAVSWANSGLNNMRLLLGCEVIGDGNRVTNGIHVIKDEQTVMVRYVFLLTSTAYAPVANHIVTPMLSAMCAMRTGLV